MHAFCRAAAFWNLMHLELMHTSLVGEQQQILMIRRRQKILDKIVVRRVQACNALAAALLLLVIGQAWYA